MTKHQGERGKGKSGAAALCPRCADQRLVAKDLKGLAVQVCDGCHGILMARAALEAATALVKPATPEARRVHTANDYFSSLSAAAEFVGHKHTLLCPSCRYDMYEVKSRDLLVDFCLNCQALWFDEGELQRVMAMARERGDVDLVPDSLKGNRTAELICYMLGTIDA